MVMQYLYDGPEDARHVYLFAHGAGAPMDHRNLTAIARGLAERGIRVVRFEFPYMARRRETGKRGGPDRPPILLDTWRQAIADHGGGAKVIIGGMSMGGRIASMVADEAGARALICFSYPFHPPGAPEKTRTAHLEQLRTPALFLQGTRDPFGSPQEVAGYPLSQNIRVHWIEGGDHSLKGGLPRVIEAAAMFTSEQ